MRKIELKVVSVLLTVILVFIALTGCANLLEGFWESVTEHQTAPPVRPATDQISVSSFEELKATILDVIMEYESSIQLLYNHHDEDDIHAEIERASFEILNEHPVGVFAVNDITGEATRIITHFEVDITIEYKRTKEQLDSIINVTSIQSMMRQLLQIMSQYNEEMVIRTGLQFSKDDIAEFIRETYYRNPRNIIILPFETVEIFPETGSDRIFELKFSYMESPGMLRRFSEDLTTYVRRGAEMATGETEAEEILSLVSNLVESTTFEEIDARSIHVHGAQEFVATAFGALVHRSAVGEGFAMALKALMDELGLDCKVVLGYYDGMIHAWNIVYLYGDYYHIDVAMCVVNGIETAFLKTDKDFEEMYEWDRRNTVRCEGELTLEDIIGSEETDVINGEDQHGETDNGEEEN